MRYNSVPRCSFKRGRRASRTACPRGASARYDLPDDYRSSRSGVTPEGWTIIHLRCLGGLHSVFHRTQAVKLQFYA
ncbi:DUF1534 domain-containing protein [Pseudomonas syringae USA011]|nr:DUF1534 domain-containing protein [Pseudomonas syringae USA011]